MRTLKEARTDKGIKQCAVAEAIGVTRQTYAKYEDNPAIMPIGKAVSACRFIGVEISEIFFADRGN